MHTRGMVGTRHPRARRVEPPTPLESREALADPSYRDAFEIAVNGDVRPAERWARATFEGAPRALRWTVLIGWRALGFRLGPQQSEDHVLGWAVVESTPARILLAVRSVVLGPARLELRVDDSRVVLGTAVQFSWRGARAVWAVVGPVHRQILPYLLTHRPWQRRWRLIMSSLRPCH